MTVLSEPALDAGLDAAAARRAMIDSQLRPSGVNHPRVLGAGKRFWPELDAPLRLRPKDRHTFASGVEVRTFVKEGGDHR